MKPNPLATLWESLHEPRQETAMFVAGYTVLALAGLGVLLTAAGPLPTGTWSARVAAGGVLLIGGALGAPTAWRGMWWLERVATVIIGVGAVLRILAIFVFRDSVAEPTAILGIGAWIFIVLMMRVRSLRVSAAPFRFGAGPLLPETQAQLAADRLREAERRHDEL
jgi:hypothetical protein